MKKKTISFAEILHLAESYQEEYKERNLCLSEAENDAFFKDYVWQYQAGLKPSINTEIPLF